MIGAAPPLLELRGLAKLAGGPVPLRIDRLVVHAADRLVLSGLDPASAEMLTHLICGAALPDEGEVLVGGVPTREVRTEGDWLASLDRFGLVSGRAVLVESLPVEANMAMPLTLSIDAVPADVRERVHAVAGLVGLGEATLSGPTSALSASDRLRVHLARAVLPAPQLILLEHPTTGLVDGTERTRFGQLLRNVADRERIGWLAISDDVSFARAAAATIWRVDTASGTTRRVRHLWPWLRGSRGR